MAAERAGCRGCGTFSLSWLVTCMGLFFPWIKHPSAGTEAEAQTLTPVSSCPAAHLLTARSCH